MSIKFKTVLYEKKDKVVLITLNRPEKLNAINIQMNSDLIDALEEAKNDDTVRSIVITGAGKAFCAGGDISDFTKGAFTSKDKKVKPKVIRPQNLFYLNKPIIAAVNGVAVGFGTNLTICCDIVYASENASFGEFFIRMGIIPDMNGSLLLPLLVGPHKAKELIFSGKRIDASEALRIGLVNQIFPQEQLLPKTMEFAHHLAKQAPIALSLSKKAIHKGYEKIFDEMIKLQWEYNEICYASEDHKEAAQAFLEKRKPFFKGK
jgi:enoyl-CoA hydratase/carnithine racemase